MLDALLTKTYITHSRSVVKSITWRVLGSIDTFVLSFIITGNFVWAGSIASTEVITKMVLYYFHERAWAHVKWGYKASEPESAPTRPIIQVVTASSQLVDREQLEFQAARGRG
jgi:uncharacterized membrane protein